ncbi:ESCRT-I complex subunit like [Capsicum chacoense]
MDEISKKEVTDGVKSKLVSQLTSGTTTSLDDMVNFANSAFTMLNLFGADYGSFYNDAKDLIKHKYDLLTADRKLLSVSELEEKYLDAVTKEEQCVKGDEQKRAAHRIAQVEVEKLRTQMKAARVAQGEIEWCKNKALQGIESTTQCLLSYK